jgi:hypothetical protein
VVVFPAPFGPRSPTISPWDSFTATSFTTRRRRYIFTSPSARSVLAPAAPFPPSATTFAGVSGAGTGATPPAGVAVAGATPAAMEACSPV